MNDAAARAHDRAAGGGDGARGRVRTGHCMNGGMRGGEQRAQELARSLMYDRKKARDCARCTVVCIGHMAADVYDVNILRSRCVNIASSTGRSSENA